MFKKKTFWNFIGITLFTIGCLLLVNFALRSSPIPYAVISVLIALSGMALIAWLWDDD
ncbi:MAG: hypothetical protein AABX19_03085 [Nanoarchaeota archaeon]